MVPGPQKKETACSCRNGFEPCSLAGEMLDEMIDAWNSRIGLSTAHLLQREKEVSDQSCLGDALAVGVAASATCKPHGMAPAPSGLGRRLRSWPKCVRCWETPRGGFFHLSLEFAP